MTDKEKQIKRKVIEILKRPSYKKAPCSWCGASGIVNRRGMISSDPCPKCDDGIATVKSYAKWTNRIMRIII